VSRFVNWRDVYDRDPAIIYALDEELRFVRCNPAWDRFAAENGAPNLTGNRMAGAAIMDVVPEVLRSFYLSAYDSVTNLRTDWRFIFDCSSAEVSRSFQMRILPNEITGFLVVNTLIREEPHPDQVPCRIEEYTDADEIVTMCANCRRAEHLTQPGRWDFVPQLLATNDVLVKPSLCSFCFHYHYPGSGLRR
jgi:hypothetical protein